MNFLVIGGSGFIGSNLVKQLKKEKNKDDGLVNIDIRDALYFDARNEKQMENYTKDTDIVIHCGNIPAHRLSMSDPYSIIENNYNATLGIAEAVRKSKQCKKIIFLSSFSVYGNKNIPPWTEDMQTQPITPYSLCKIQCEELLQKYHEWYGLDVIIIRPTTVYGPNERLHEPLTVLPLWFDAIKEEKPLIVYGKDTVRDWTHVYDIVQGILLASRKTDFEIYNLCSNNPIKLLDIANFLSDNVIVKELPQYETSQWWGSFDKAKKELEWEPVCDFWAYLKKIRLNTN